MTVFLNVLFIFVGVLFFAGRMYEVMYLLEEGTHFLTSQGIVSTLPMLAIVFLISICCGVLVFADKEPEAKGLKFPVGVFGFAAAPFLVFASVLNIIGIFQTGGFLGYDIMMILGAIGLVMLGIMNIKGKKKEKLPVVMVMMIPLALAMNAVILKVQPLANTMYLYTSLSAITLTVFFLMLFKSAYAPSATSLPVLYVSALVNFMVSGAAALANFIGGFFASSLPLAEILLNVALAVLGIYSLFIAFYIMPSAERPKAQPKQPEAKKAKPAKASKKTQKLVELDEADYESEFEDYNEDEPEEAEEYVSDFLPKASQITASAKSAWQEESSQQNTNQITQATIAMLFEQKEANEHKAVINTAVKEVTAEIAVTQALEKHATMEIPTQPTQVISLSETKPAKTEKTLFKGSGKKETSGKVVYKAPKK